MKIKTKGSPTKSKPVTKPERKTRGSGATALERFLALKPINPEKIGMVGSKSLRPLLSTAAKAHQLNYVSFSIPGDEENCVFVVLAE